MISGSIRNSAIAELRIAHWQIWKTCVIAFCALRKQICGIAYCGPEKHVALPTSGGQGGHYSSVGWRRDVAWTTINVAYLTSFQFFFPRLDKTINVTSLFGYSGLQETWTLNTERWTKNTEHWTGFQDKVAMSISFLLGKLFVIKRYDTVRLLLFRQKLDKNPTVTKPTSPSNIKN